ncbi:hypothetical protein ACP70R_033546 [Stipagrostis hirtigluma subsp. patula]
MSNCIPACLITYSADIDLFLRSGAMALEWLLHLWNEWAIQILVLLSFMLQVFLVFFADWRRRSSSPVLRVSLWLAYQFADFTVVYALGHLSYIGSPGSPEHQLVAFWAPFLLLHLGGQDTITAYALEDNNLWGRHLQVLVVQALGVAYVLYKYMAGSGTPLLLASISMFVAGIVKYGERIWALKCGAINNIGRMHHNLMRCASEHEDFDRFVTEDMSEEKTLLHAHCQFEICQSAFSGMILVSRNAWVPSLETIYRGVDLYKLVEMELSVLYDILYTKTAVIHTWYGICIRIILLLCTATTFLLFQFRGMRDGYSRVDVIISYVLLVGASVLDAVSLCRALLSSWTRYLLCCRDWKWLFGVVTDLRMLVTSLPMLHPLARSRLWTYSIGQYNLFHLATRDKTELGATMAKSWLGLELGLRDWWNKLHFSGTFSGTDSLSVERLKELILQELQRAQLDEILRYRSRGRATLDKVGAYKGHARLSLEIDIDQSIIAWHIATDIYIQESYDQQHDPELIEATKVLSNYMMFLLMQRPEMLTPRAADISYVRFPMEKIYEGCSADRDHRVMESPTSLWHRLKHLFHHEGPLGSRIPQRAELAKALFQRCKGSRIPEDLPRYVREKYADIQRSTFLAQELLDLDKPGSRDMLKLIFGVWVEMMLYSAQYGSQDSYAKQLSNGGEFITIVWILAHHQIYHNDPSV